MRHTFLIIPVLFLIQESGFTQDHPIDSMVQACISANPCTICIIECYVEAEKSWDDELNKNYKRLMSEADDSTKKLIRSAQLAWITYRDKEFHMISELINVIPLPMYQSFAVMRRTEIIRARALEIKNYYRELLMARDN